MKDGYDDITLFPLDVTGYTKILRVYSKHNYSLSTNKAYIAIDPDAESLILHGYGADKTASLRGFNESLKKRYPTSMMTLGSNDLTTTLEVDGFTIKLILQ